MAEGARLESVYTATYRGFESLSLRHIINIINKLKRNPARLPILLDLVVLTINMIHWQHLQPFHVYVLNCLQN